MNGVARIDVAGYNDNARSLIMLPDFRPMLVGGGAPVMGNTDGMVDLGALKRTLQTRVSDPNANPFRDGSLDGAINRGGGEDRGRIQEAYLLTINQRREDTTVISVTYLIGPL